MSVSTISEWRQCSCFFAIDSEDVKNIIHPNHWCEDGIYVILTHSCSVSIEDFDKEPLAEYILARPVKKDNAYVGRNNPRKLHLDFIINGSPSCFEFNIHERMFFDRRLLNKIKPESNLLSDKNKQTLVRWVASRYAAPAFPDEFNRRFRPVLKIFETELKKPHGGFFTSVYIILDPDEEELGENDVYEAEFIMSVLSSTSDEDLKKCEELIGILLDKISFHLKGIGIELCGKKISLLQENQITLDDLRSAKLLPMDYLSERETPGGEYPAPT